jgi:hypothetical protein
VSLNVLVVIAGNKVGSRFGRSPFAEPHLLLQPPL